jgi:hypothetical protein
MMWIFVVLVLLLAAPLLGALTANNIIQLTNLRTALLALPVVVAAVLLVRFVSRKGHRNRHRTI